MRMRSLEAHNLLVLTLHLCAASTFIALRFVVAPYGRHARKGFGPSVRVIKAYGYIRTKVQRYKMSKAIALISLFLLATPALADGGTVRLHRPGRAQESDAPLPADRSSQGQGGLAHAAEEECERRRQAGRRPLGTGCSLPDLLERGLHGRLVAALFMLRPRSSYLYIWIDIISCCFCYYMITICEMPVMKKPDLTSPPLGAFRRHPLRHAELLRAPLRTDLLGSEASRYYAVIDGQAWTSGSVRAAGGRSWAKVTPARAGARREPVAGTCAARRHRARRGALDPAAPRRCIPMVR